MLRVLRSTPPEAARAGHGYVPTCFLDGIPGPGQAAGQAVGESLSMCLPTILCGSLTGCVLAGRRPGGSWLKRGLLRLR